MPIPDGQKIDDVLSLNTIPELHGQTEMPYQYRVSMLAHADLSAPADKFAILSQNASKLYRGRLQLRVDLDYSWTRQRRVTVALKDDVTSHDDVTASLM